ncbi:MAG: hypothetical protein M1269_06020 [Chloroflexi bacterium]|nr:hypothetical protein [Chloroflexota bacterium]
MDSKALKKQRNELTIGFLIMGIFGGGLYGYSMGGSMTAMIINAVINGIIGGGAGAAIVRILYLSPYRTYSMLLLGLAAIGIGGMFFKSWGAFTGVIILWAALFFQPLSDDALPEKKKSRRKATAGEEEKEEVVIPKKGDKAGIEKQ